MRRNKEDISIVTETNIGNIKSPFSGENTYTTLFLVPAFDVYMDTPFYKYFINAYIDDKDLTHYFKRPLFILVHLKDNSDRTADLQNYLVTRKAFIYDYIVGTKDGSLLKMYVFECPSKFKADYDLFLKARYSKFSNDYKAKFNRIITSVTGQNMESPLYGAVHRTPTMKKKVEAIIGEVLDKEQEYFGELKPDYEIFRYVKV